jgi:hypothetical protein
MELLHVDLKHKRKRPIVRRPDRHMQCKQGEIHRRPQAFLKGHRCYFLEEQLQVIMRGHHHKNIIVKMDNMDLISASREKYLAHS